MAVTRSRRDLAAQLVLWLAVALFVALVLPLGLDRDDRIIVGSASGVSYARAWTAPFLDLFYRPLVLTLAKASLDLFGQLALPFRLLQGLLIVASVAVFLTLRPSASRFTRSVAGLCLLASPLTYVAITHFAVGIADSLVGLALLLAVKRGLGDQERDPWVTIQLLGLSLIALAAKESGVLVALYSALHCLSRRRWAGAGLLLALAGGYVVLRASLVPEHAFGFRTAYFLEMLTPSQLAQRFGDSPLPLYAHNVVANLVNALFGVPGNRALTFGPAVAARLFGFALTSLVVVFYLVRQRAWLRHAPLLAIVPANALLGYMYVRDRVMFVAGIAIAILLLHALDQLANRRQRVLGVRSEIAAGTVALVWLVFLVAALIRLRLQAGA